MNILSCIAGPYWGGLHVVIERTTPHFASRGHSRHVALPVADETMRSRLEAAGARLIDWQPGRPRKTLNPVTHFRYVLRFASDVAAIRAAIRTHEIDVVEVAGLLNLQPVVAARLARRPIVWQFHGTVSPRPVRVLIAKLAVRLARVIMTSGKGMVARHGGLDGSPVPVVPFAAPIDTDRFRPDPEARERARKEMGYASNEVVVGTLGNRGWPKRHEFIVKIARSMRGIPVKFAIVGAPVATNDAYYRTAVIDPIANEGLNDQVAVIDQFADAEVIMNGFDIFILPSMAEGLSLVTAEALATGLPVVASEVGSVPDMVDETVGRICDVDSVEDFVAGITALIDPQRRAAMADACRARALENTGNERCAEDHFRAYALATDAP